MVNETKTGRDTATGQFKHSVDRLCVCGHPLSIHSAAKVANERPCFSGDFGEPCECENFKPARRRS